MEKVISVAELARNTTRIAEDVQTTHAIYRIKRGRRAMALLDWEEFESWRVAADLLSRPGWREKMEQGTRDLEAGRGYELHATLRELGREPLPRAKRKKRTGGTARTRRTRSR